LPFTPGANITNQVVAAMLYDGSSNTYQTALGIVSPSTGYVTLRADGLAGAVTGTAPFAFGSTDQIRISGSYSI
jgi:hypothetical protein